MYKFYTFFLFFCFNFTFSQIVHKKINSSKLGQERAIKIQLPKSYDAKKEKSYPLIITLDGDYLFDPMAGNVSYYSYWDDMPEAIVVGVNMERSREADTEYDEQRYLPTGKGAGFFEFLGMELLPYLDQNYRTSKFVVIAGHDLTANFINYYLFKEKPLFHAYINLSPDLAPEMTERLAESLQKAETPKWFYLATGSNDVPQLKKSILELDTQLKTLSNSTCHYTFDEFEGATHYTLVGRALPRALENIFKSYRPIDLADYDAMTSSGNSPYKTLTDKYDQIKSNFGIEKTIRVNDFLATGKALEYLENWDDLEKLGALARKQYPSSALGTYYLARSYEANGQPKKAMKTYQSAYGQDEVAFVTIDFMLQKAELIKEDFGY